MAHVRTLARCYKVVNGERVHWGPGEWLDIIHEVNEVEPGTFLAPLSLGPWVDGGEAEEYPDARVIHRNDGTDDVKTVSIVSKTAKGDQLIRAVCAKLDIHVTD